MGSGCPAGQYDSYGHAFRDIVEGDGEHQHGVSFELGAGAFGFGAVLVQVGDGAVQEEEK